MTVSVTRYGNVMYSRGSVIPAFIGLLKAGQPLTLTEPRMTRFLMSLAESVDLVEHAFSHAEPGDLFVTQGPGVTVDTLARAVGRLFGRGRARRPRHRHPARREAARDPAHAARRSPRRRPGRLLPRALDARGLQYEKYFSEGEDEVSPRRGLHLRQHPPARHRPDRGPAAHHSRDRRRPGAGAR